jgi:transposase
MSLPKNQPEELFGLQNTMKNLLLKDHEMAVFSREIYPLFSDNEFKDCYSDKGRNAIPPSFLAMVTLLQWRESLSDDETAEAVYLRLDWKYALHLPLEEGTFNSSTLCVFRRRLKEKEKESYLFDKLLELCREKGFIKKNTKQRVDATHIVKHINRIATTDLLFRAVKCLVEEIEKKAFGYYEKNIPEDIKERYEGKFSSFGMSKETRADKQAEIVEDGFRLKKILEEYQSESTKELIQLEIMETIFRENVTIRTKEIEAKTFIEVEEVECPKQTIFEPREPDLKLGKKGKLSWVGEKCHIVETAEKGEVNFILDMVPQRAQESDQKMHPELMGRNESKGLNPEKVYVDGNYLSGKSIKEYEEKGQILMGYIQEGSTNKPEGFQTKDFKIDMKQQKAICPKGEVSSRWTYYKKRKFYKIYFTCQQCRNCACLSQCVTDRSGRRQLQLGEDYVFTAKRREEQEAKEFRAEMSVRAQIEGTISAAVRNHGLRKIKYKGPKGRQLQYYMSACALNFCRMVKKMYCVKTKG